MFRTAYRITGNAADAEDVSQIVFLRLFRREEDAQVLDNRVVQNEESYLRRAAINAALDVMRSRQGDRTVELPDLPSEPAHDDPRELRQALGRALAQLKPRPAEIFALRFLEGFSNPQIARMLGISQVLVAVIVHRTRQQLRKELRPYLSARYFRRQAMKNEKFDRLLSEIRNEQVDDKIVAQAGERVLKSIAGAAPSAALNAHTLRSCEDFQALIPAYLGKQLAPARALLFEDHMHACVACRHALERARDGELQTVWRVETKRPRSMAWGWAMGAAAVFAVAVAGLRV